MDNVNFTRNRIIGTIIWMPFSFIGFFIYLVLEKRLEKTTDVLANIKIEGLMELLKNISPFIFIFFILLGIIIWLYWIINDRLNDRLQFYKSINDNIELLNMRVKYLMFLSFRKGDWESVDIITLQENFNEEEIEKLGFDINEINIKCQKLNKKRSQ